METGTTKTPQPKFQIASIKIVGGTEIPVPAGGVTAIVGGNNSGKSTLLRQIDHFLRTEYEVAFPFHEHRMLEKLTVSKSGTPEEFADWVEQNSGYQRPTRDNSGLTEGYVRPGMGSNALPRHLTIERWKNLADCHLGPIYPFLAHYIPAGGGASFTASQRPRPGGPPNHDIHFLEDHAHLRDAIDNMCYTVFGVHLTLDKLTQNVTLRVGQVPPEIPPPGYYDDAVPFREALDKLSPLDNQGDGMRAFIGKLLPIMTAAHHVVIVDEPEAFLHPPQAVHLGRLLGRLSKQTGVQIILATHDRNVIVGLLDSECPLSVVRLNRIDESTTASQLEPDEISAIWSDPVLRYSNVLDGLFHSRVILVENERDCTFYAAALDAAHDSDPLPITPSEVLFVPTNGKDGIAPVIKSLKAIRVPTIASPDIDILNDKQKIKKLVEHMEGTDSWTQFDSQYESIVRQFRTPKKPLLASQVAVGIEDFLKKTLAENPTRQWDNELSIQLRTLTRSEGNPWDSLKKQGTAAFDKTVELAAADFFSKMDRIGLVIVKVGELEGFARGYGIEERKGNGWLRAALTAGVHKGDNAIEHARRLCFTPATVSLEPQKGNQQEAVDPKRT